MTFAEPGHRFRNDRSHPAVGTARRPSVGEAQPSLPVESPGSHREREADRLSVAVAGNVPATAASAGRAKSRPADGGRAPSDPLNVVWSGGQPLDAATRAFMEPRLGHDFSLVRVHADGEAAESAERLGARAYTVGRHVVFGSGQFAPAAASGRRVLAHELAHVVQQASVAPRVQRYESGEHAALGETQAELQAATAP